MDVKTVATLQHLLLPSLIPHTACWPLPLTHTCNFFNCPWSSLMLYSQYFLYAWPLVLFALLFSCKCDALCLISPVTQMPVVSVCLHVCPCSLIPNPVFLMPSALYGFLFLSDCTHGSYRDGSHAMRWKHSALDQGSSHLSAHISGKCMLIHVQ